MRVHRISVKLTPDEYSRLEELRPDGMSESAFFRDLLRRAGPVAEIPSRLEALRLLASSARAGKVQAQVALERALREHSERDLMEWIRDG